MKRMNVVFLCLLMSAVLLQALPAQAQVEITIEKHEQYGSYVLVPKLTGMLNTFVQDRINQSIMADGGYETLLSNLSAATSDGGGALQSDVQAAILPGRDGQDVLSVRIESSGRIGPGRPSHGVRSLMYRLTTGEPVTAADIFVDVEQAEAGIADIIQEHITDDVSSYLNADAYLPLPLDNMLLDEQGVTLYYDAQQLSLLSGRAGSLHLHYDEVAPLLNITEDSLLWQLQVNEKLAPNEKTADSIRESVLQARLPGLPVILGDSAEETLMMFPKASDSMSFPGGLRYQLEDDRFRGSAIIVDGGKVTGIITQRMNLFGLIIGKATKGDVTAVLGPETASLPLEGNLAERYHLPAGTLVDYQYESMVLRLLYGVDNVLQAIWLSSAT